MSKYVAETLLPGIRLQQNALKTHFRNRNSGKERKGPEILERERKAKKISKKKKKKKKKKKGMTAHGAGG